jgi:hypothetical protein
MSTSRKRICSNDVDGGNIRAESSYTKMKAKMKKYEFELEQLRKELLETRKSKGEVELTLEKLCIEQEESDRRIRGSSKEGQTSYSILKVKLKSSQEELAELAQVHIVLQETQRVTTEFEARFNLLQMDLVKERMELQETQRNESELLVALDLVRTEMADEKIKFKRLMGLRLIHMEQLKATIAAGNIAYDAMAAKVEVLEKTTEQQNSCKYHSTRHAVCRAFGWSLRKADPVLLRAACGFWEGSMLDGQENNRNSVLTRQQIWYELTCRGFKGKVLYKMERGFKERKKFDISPSTSSQRQRITGRLNVFANDFIWEMLIVSRSTCDSTPIGANRQAGSMAKSSGVIVRNCCNNESGTGCSNSVFLICC